MTTDGRSFCVASEVGRLKRVMLHRPGLELERLTIHNKDELLFDDILWQLDVCSPKRCGDIQRVFLFADTPFASYISQTNLSCTIARERMFVDRKAHIV